MMSLLTVECDLFSSSPLTYLKRLLLQTAPIPTCIFTLIFMSLQSDMSVDSLLQSLGLEKYLITFKAEEVCILVL